MSHRRLSPITFGRDSHVEDIRRFLSKGRYRFFPEIVLGLRSKGATDPIVTYAKKRSSLNDKAYLISVKLKGLREDGFTRIRRIDGNHRLEAAKRLVAEQRASASFKDFSKAPFCFVILDSDRPEDDDLAEAMLFNLINSKALPIGSEHSLSVIMRDDGAAGERFVEDPQVYLTRWIHEKVKHWPQGFYAAMGDTPLSRLHAAAHVLLRPGGISKASQDEMESEAAHLFGPIYELAVRLRDNYENFVHSYAFIPIASEIYARHSKVDAARGATPSLSAFGVLNDGFVTLLAGSTVWVAQTCLYQPSPVFFGPSSSATSKSNQARYLLPCRLLASRL